MTNQQIIVCAFCQGTGKNPHFKGTCPVCKGRGKNQAIGKYMTCSSCRGSGQKKGTTLTCYDCGGLGVLPDTRETFMRAQEEIKEAQEEMARERPVRNASRQRLSPQAMAEDCFCQSCAKKINRESTLKVCLECFHKMKEIA